MRSLLSIANSDRSLRACCMTSSDSADNNLCRQAMLQSRLASCAQHWIASMQLAIGESPAAAKGDPQHCAWQCCQNNMYINISGWQPPDTSLIAHTSPFQAPQTVTRQDLMQSCICNLQSTLCLPSAASLPDPVGPSSGTPGLRVTSCMEINFDDCRRPPM